MSRKDEQPSVSTSHVETHCEFCTPSGRAKSAMGGSASLPTASCTAAHLHNEELLAVCTAT